MVTKKETFNKAQIALSSTSHLVTDLYSSFIVGLIPILTVRFGLSLFLVSILTSVNFVSNSFTQPIFGLLSDRHGIRQFMILGPFFGSVFISLLGIAPSYYTILLLLFLGNISIAAFHPSSASVAGHFGGERKGLGNSIISFGGNLGYAAGSLFIIFIVEQFGLSYTPVTMVPGIIMSIILFKTIRSPKINIFEHRDTNIFTKIKKVKKSKIGLIAIIIFTSYSRDIIWISLATFIPLYFAAQGITLINIGYLLLSFGLAGALGGILSGYYYDRLKYRTLFIQAGLLISVPLLFFVFRTDNPLSIIFYILGGFFLISTLPLCIRLSQKILPSNLGLASSLVIGLSGGLAALTVILLGRIADIIGIVATISAILILPVISSILLGFFSVLEKKA